MDKKSVKIIKIVLIILQFFIFYMLLGNTLYLINIFKTNLKALPIILGVLDILLNIFISYINIKTIYKISNANKSNEKNAINLLLIFNIVNIFIYFLDIMYRMNAYILYCISTIGLLVILKCSKKIFTKGKSNFKTISDRTKAVLQMLSVVLIIFAMGVDFIEFNQISKVTANIVEQDKKNEHSSNISENNKEYNIKELYQNKKTNVMFKYAISVTAIAILLIASINYKKTIVRNINNINMFIFILLAVFFIGANNVFYAYAQIPLIFVLITNFEKHKKVSETKKI
ncbi:MAG: hypothetical protein RSB51_00190 [Clostridia bacterium]